jgi:ornithine carbamoyltransferase
MFSTLKIPSLRTIERLPPQEVNALLATARSLQLAERSGATPPLLRGKKFGLMGELDRADAAMFEGAVTALGGTVAHIPGSLTDLSRPGDLEHTARMLGRLYDAVECHGVPPALVQQVGDVAGIPVYDGLASPEHPTAKLAGLLGGDGADADHRRHLLQAVLLSTIA